MLSLHVCLLCYCISVAIYSVIRKRYFQIVDMDLHFLAEYLHFIVLLAVPIVRYKEKINRTGMGTGATLRPVLNIRIYSHKEIFPQICIQFSPNNSLYEKNIFTSVGCMQNKSTYHSRFSSHLKSELLINQSSF